MRMSTEIQNGTHGMSTASQGTKSVHPVKTITSDKLQSIIHSMDSANTSSSPKASKNTQTMSEKSLTLDVLDLSRVIDIHAESQAVEAFDAEMGRERNGIFQKMKGFFARSFQRMGRDAWIDTKKREITKDIKDGLKNGTYTEASLREHVMAGDNGISEKAYLRHEEGMKTDTLPANIQVTVDAWMSAPAGSAQRTALTLKLKSVIESNYPAITADMSQLEASLLRLERAKLSSEIDTVEAKLNVFDIGRIEQGNGKRKEGWFVKMADSISNTVNASKLPDWMKQKIAGLVRHPNTAAVLTALGTRAGVGAIAGATVATGFAGGFLLPIIAGSVTGGFFAGVRARREMRDRTAQIDRRGAMGLETGHERVDGKSSNSSHRTNSWQHPAMDLYNRVQLARNGSPESMEDALVAGIYYLVKHRVGREKGINMLQYDADKSVSRQHVEMIRLMNEIFPGLVASFNDGSLFAPDNTNHEAKMAREFYAEITTLANKTMTNRMDEEGKYALKQGAIFGVTAAVVGGTIGATVHEIMSLGGNSSIDSNLLGSTSHYPNGMEPKIVHRGFWYDNGTPAPKFDHTELMIHTDKTGGWNVSHMLQKAATTLHHGSHTVGATDFTGENIQAVITPTKGGPSFVLPIDARGNIQIPASMQDAFNNRTFAWLEVGEVKMGTDGHMNLNPLATVVGKGGMMFDPVLDPLPSAHDAEWMGIPFGANRYHELGKKTEREPVGTFIEKEPPKEPQNILPEEGVQTGTPEPKPEAEKINSLSPRDDNDGNPGEMVAEKEKLDNLWNEIVKIRQTLEGRKSGDMSLSLTAVANMQDTEKKLLEEYQKQRGAWNERMKNLENMPKNKIQFPLMKQANLPIAPVPQKQESIVKANSEAGENMSPDANLNAQFEAATRILGTFVPINDEELTKKGGLFASVGGLLENEQHRTAMEHLLTDAKMSGKTAMRAISAFYGKNQKIWLSKNTSDGHNSTHIGNIVVGLKSSNETNSASYFSRRLYEISGAHPIPEDPTIVLFHELGHQITKKARYAAADGDGTVNTLISEVQELRDDQGAGITPLSSMPFYQNRYRNNPEWNTQFWEDMAELMGLYLRGREYVVKYLDDRITTRRSMKANITEGLRDRIMNLLDTSYNEYIA